MDYHKNLLKKIKEKEWPDFDRSDFLDELDQLAMEMYEKKTTEGYLASFLIFQQLSEEMLRLLIRLSDLYLQFSILPLEIKSKDLNKKTFGQLISELKNSVCDFETKELIINCREMNDLRIRLVHKITRKTSVEDIQKQSMQAKKIHGKIYSLFEIIQDDYYILLSRYSDDYENYKEMIDEYLIENLKTKTTRSKKK